MAEMTSGKQEKSFSNRTTKVRTRVRQKLSTFLIRLKKYILEEKKEKSGEQQLWERTRRNQYNLKKKISFSHFCLKSPCQWSWWTITEKKQWAHTGTTVFAAEFLFPQKTANGCTVSSPSRNATQKVNFRTARHGFWHLIDSLNAFYLISLARSRSLHFSWFPNAASHLLLFFNSQTPTSLMEDVKRQACFVLVFIY